MKCDHVWLWSLHLFEYVCTACYVIVRQEDAYIVGLSTLHDFATLSNVSVSKLFEEINGLRS